MKKILTLASLAFAFAACSSVPTTYTVSGTVDSTLNGQMVYLFDYNDNTKVDSVVIADSKFSFTGKADSAVIRRVNVGRESANIILENGNIVVDFEKRNATGTPMNDSLASYSAKLEAIYTPAREQFTAIRKDSTLNDSTKNAKFEAIQKEAEEKIVVIFEPIFNANSNNALGTFILWSSSLPEAAYDSALAKAGDAVKNFGPIAREIKRKEILQNTSAGKMFVDFEVVNAKGDTVKFSDYVGKGKAVVVDFWASWCGPCRAEIPNLANIHKKYGKDVEVIGLNVWDKDEAAKKAVVDHKMEWTILTDPKTNNATDLYGINGIPQIILIGGDGVIVARDLREGKIEEAVKGLLKK